MSSITPHSRSKCPKCFTVVRFEATEQSQPKKDKGDGAFTIYRFSRHADHRLEASVASCPDCHQIIVTIQEIIDETVGDERTIWPLTSGKSQAPVEVPLGIAKGYNEACLVLPFSSKASAALSRRCLQDVLSDKDGGNSQKRNLSEQIDEVFRHYLHILLLTLMQ